jgi:hypothetical protein
MLKISKISIGSTIRLRFPRKPGMVLKNLSSILPSHFITFIKTQLACKKILKIAHPRKGRKMAKEIKIKVDLQGGKLHLIRAPRTVSHHQIDQ